MYIRVLLNQMKRTEAILWYNQTEIKNTHITNIL